MADAPKLLPTDSLRMGYPKINQAIDNANEAKLKADIASNKASIVCASGLPDIIINSTEISLNLKAATAFYTTKKSYAIPSDTKISLDKFKTNHYVFLNIQSGGISVINSLSEIMNLNDNNVNIATITLQSATSLRSVELSCDYTVNGLLATKVGVGSITTSYIAESAISSSKRTTIGSLCSLNIGAPFKLPNIDMTNKKIQIYGMTGLVWNNNRYNLQSDPASVLEIDFSSIWDNGAITPFVYFNTKTLGFEVYKSTDYATVKEENILFAVLHKDSFKELIGVTMLSSHTINGIYSSKYFGDKSSAPGNPYYSPINIPNGWYEAPVVEGYDAPNHVSDNITLNDIYSVYDNLVSQYPDYVTKVELGTDSSGTYPMYRYEFKPIDVYTSTNNEKNPPKIILISGVHGEEKSSIVSLRNFVRDVATSWKTNSLLEFVRWNVHLIIIPIMNPYGFIRYQRKNGNGVDLNRQGSFRWETGGSTNPNAQDYKGTAPFSEKEAQYLRDAVLSNLDAIAFYDYHMNGSSGDIYNRLFWHEFDGQNNTYTDLNTIAKHDIKKLTIEAHKRYNVPENSGFIGEVTYNNANPTLAAYVYSKGIKGHVVECTRKMVDESNVYSARTMQICTEFIGNKILSTVRGFTKK